MDTHRKVALVTGASRGLGEAIVASFRERGFGVVATSRGIAPSTDEFVVAVPGDIRERGTAQRAADAAIERFGRIDTLVNNAGIFVAKPFADYTTTDYADVTDTNVTGVFHATQVVLPFMRHRGSGHVVTITASLAEQPRADVPAALAALTKGGLNAFTRSLAIELAATGIRVNAVAPGIIRTPMHAPESYDFLARLQPIGRMGEARDVVDAIHYLDASPFVTGEILHVDGGMAAGIGS